MSASIRIIRRYKRLMLPRART